MEGDWKEKLQKIKKAISPAVEADKAWYLALLDEDAQRRYEENRLRALLIALKIFHLNRYCKKIAELKGEISEIAGREGYSAEDYRTLLAKKTEIRTLQHSLDAYKCFFREPYFARMDVVDDKEGYNSYYIGKKGDVDLEIVDWRAPLAVRYYQKSRVNFRINDYDYKTVLRRSLSVKCGKLLDFRNEYLSVRDELTPEEIAGRDEEILFDPYLRSIIKSRKDDVHVRDIIETIQEQQFELINRPERESYVLQGCAGSGKTMILLHRLSYLLYNNEALKSRDVLVITPSHSFNTFIDELAQVLELEKVRTVTLQDYFFRVLASEGVDLASKMTGERESEAYLKFLYSEKFESEVTRKIQRLYADMVGLFTAEECKTVAKQLLFDCDMRAEKFTKIKNASTRVRRAVLGELKDNGEGGFYFTKSFRAVMGDFAQVGEFLRFVLEGAQKTPDFFFRRFREFYHCLKNCALHADAVLFEARESLSTLQTVVLREIDDLKRYRIRRLGEEVYTYAERIARREDLLAEIEEMKAAVEAIGEGTSLLAEFSAVVRSGPCAELGRCKDTVGIVRWLYRETVKKYKARFGLHGVYPSDAYALCRVLAETGKTLTPRYGLVFVDEGQDLSEGEFKLLRRIHSDAAFNVFGDLRQNITPFRGIGNWEKLGFPVYTLDRNYRNTNEIVEYVLAAVSAEMLPIGLHGETVEHIPITRVQRFFRAKSGRKAVIVQEKDLKLFEKRGFKRPAADGRLSDTSINVLTVYESKGLEFAAVAVLDGGMSENERYIAYTRATSSLACVEVV